MICLEVYVNDKKVAVIGKKVAQNYHATVTYWGGKDVVEVSANGATNMDKNKITETFSWGSQLIKVGDTIKVKIIDCENPDNPIEINRYDHTEEMTKLENRIIEATAKHRVKAEINGNDYLIEEAPKRNCCSFCGKDKDSVKILIDGPLVKICNECVRLCNDIIAETPTQQSQPKWPEKD